MLRKLTVKNLENIKTIIDNTDFGELNPLFLVDDRWNLFKNRILDFVNTIVPATRVKQKNQDEKSP